MRNIKAWILIQIATLLNVAFGIVAAHVLLPEAFGKFATIVAAVALMVTMLNPLLNEFARIVAIQQKAPRRLLKRLIIYSFMGCCLLAVISCVSVAETFNERVILFVILPLAFVLYSWPTAVLIGTNQMAAIGIVQITSALAKLIVFAMTLFFLVSYLGTVWGYIIGFLTAGSLGFALTRKLYVEKSGATDILPSMSIVVMLGFFLLALPFSLDQIFVQSLFAEVSGQYAAVMTYGKMVMLVSAPALAIAYGGAMQIDIYSLRGAKGIRAIIKAAIGLGVLIAVLWTINPWLFPLILGVQYQAFVQYVGIGLIGVGMHVLAFLMFQTMLLSKKKRQLFFLLLAPIIQAIGFTLYGNTDVQRLLTISLVAFSVQAAMAICTYVSIVLGVKETVTID